MIKYRVIYEGGYTEYPEDKVDDAIKLAEERKGAIDKLDVTFIVDGVAKKELSTDDYLGKPETEVLESFENIDNTIEPKTEPGLWEKIKNWIGY